MAHNRVYQKILTFAAVMIFIAACSTAPSPTSQQTPTPTHLPTLTPDLEAIRAAEEHISLVKAQAEIAKANVEKAQHEAFVMEAAVELAAATGTVLAVQATIVAQATNDALAVQATQQMLAEHQRDSNATATAQAMNFEATKEAVAVTATHRADLSMATAVAATTTATAQYGIALREAEDREYQRSTAWIAPTLFIIVFLALLVLLVGVGAFAIYAWKRRIDAWNFRQHLVKNGEDMIAFVKTPRGFIAFDASRAHGPATILGDVIEQPQLTDPQDQRETTMRDQAVRLARAGGVTKQIFAYNPQSQYAPNRPHQEPEIVDCEGRVSHWLSEARQYIALEGGDNAGQY